MDLQDTVCMERKALKKTVKRMQKRNEERGTAKANVDAGKK